MSLPVPRRKVPLRVQLAAALHQLGLLGKEPELDHDPSLALRKVNAAIGDYDPPQHDPRYLRWLAKDEHRTKTSGTKATSAGSDIWKIAHGKRIRRKQALHKTQPRNRRVTSRGFDKTKTRTFSGRVIKRLEQRKT